MPSVAAILISSLIFSFSFFSFSFLAFRRDRFIQIRIPMILKLHKIFRQVFAFWIYVKISRKKDNVFPLKILQPHLFPFFPFLIAYDLIVKLSYQRFMCSFYTLAAKLHCSFMTNKLNSIICITDF